MLSKKARILRLLLTGKPVHMRQLNAISFRYSSRLYEIRQQGYKVDTIQRGVGEYVYQLCQ